MIRKNYIRGGLSIKMIGFIFISLLLTVFTGIITTDLVKADTPYHLSVAGCDIVENRIITGKTLNGVSYDETTNTLTLTEFNASISEGGFITCSGGLNIVLVGNNTITAESNTMTWICVEGVLNITGNGTLTLDLSQLTNSFSQGIVAKKRMTIDGCSINIIGNSMGGGFYGIALSAWENYRVESNGEKCYISINNSDINISNTVNNKIINVGIDAQDADLSISNSVININLTHGNVFGMCTGLYSSDNDKSYGGKLTIDENSEIMIAANDCNNVYTTYFYQDEIKSKHIFGGEDVYKFESQKDKILHFDDIWERYECQYPYLEFTNHNWSNTVTTATESQDGKIVRICTDCGEISNEDKIAKIGTVSLANTSYKYTGVAIRPEITVKDSDGNTISDKNYTVTYADNIKVGTATVTVIFKNYYSGTVTRNFEIIEETSTAPTVSSDSTSTTIIANKKVGKAKIKTATKKSDTGIKISLKKMNGVKKYQVQFSTTKKFTKKLVKKTIKKVNVTVNSKKFKSKKLLYVRARAVKVVNKKNYYGKWSKVKKVKVKK